MDEEYFPGGEGREGVRTSDLMNNLIGIKGDRSEGSRGIEVRAALLRVKIRKSDSENSRLTCFTGIISFELA